MSALELSLEQQEKLQENYSKVKHNLALACAEAGKELNALTLVAVSKKRSSAEINFIHSLGQKVFSENYVQEALDKQADLTATTISWHFTGPIQSNKIKHLLNFDLVHSLDTKEHALKLDSYAKQFNKKQKVLIQVNIGNEEQKSGCDIKILPEFAEYILTLKNIELQGLMCITPICQDSVESRSYFSQMKELKHKLQSSLQISLPELSMGMSGDYKEAILEGASIVRIGTQIFA